MGTVRQRKACGHGSIQRCERRTGESVPVCKISSRCITKELDWTLISREQFFNCVAQNEIQGMTDIQRAARFYCRIKLSFGADLDSFGVRPRNMQKTIAYLQEASKRLNRVVIENVDLSVL